MRALATAAVLLSAFFALSAGGQESENRPFPLAAAWAAKSNSGAFTYDIPIEVPPGRVDMTPHVALLYNSQAMGTGEMGRGWTGVESVPWSHGGFVGQAATWCLIS